MYKYYINTFMDFAYGYILIYFYYLRLPMCSKTNQQYIMPVGCNSMSSVLDGVLAVGLARSGYWVLGIDIG